MYTLPVRSQQRNELIDITALIRKVLQEQSFPDGLCVVFVPHTTAAVTINENADPDVRADLLMGLERLANHSDYRHCEGNSDAHLKTSLLGSSQVVLIENGQLVLGIWQGIYLAEFDGPRQRTVYLKFIPARP